MLPPYKVFIVYAREDAQYLSELLGQLRPLEIARRIEVWSDREINPGVEWEKALVHKLDTADVILLLVSSAYYSSAYIHEVEIKRAIQRHDQGEARVLPVIVRPCAFLDDPDVGRLQVLPTDGKAVNDRRHWHDRDDAWLDVVEGLKRTLDILRAAEFREKQINEKEEEDAVFLKEVAARRYRGAAERLRKEQSRQLRRQNAPPLPIRRYATISGGILALLLMLWFGPGMFSNEKPQLVVETRKSGLELVEVAGGTFIMGCKEGRDKDCYDDDEKPAHSVTLSGFQISKYEVTQADWRSVMGNDPPELYNKGCDDCPVENVSWNDIQDFLKKLNAKYPGKNYRLPTEAEWEYAARGGSQSLGYQYAGSNNIDEVAWYEDNYKTANSFGAKKTTRPVGQKKANELGLFDMSGNVWEWCSDWYWGYRAAAQTNPNGPGSGSECVCRGGYWGFPSGGCRSAERDHKLPTRRTYGLGFRLAASSF